MLPPVLAPLWPLIRLVLDAIILRVVASLVPGLRIDSWLTAFIAVLIMSVAGWVGGPFLQFLPESFWALILLDFVLGTITLGVTALFLSGMEIRGFGALLLAGLLITTLHFLPFMLAPVLFRSGP